MAKEWSKAFYKSAAWLKCRKSFIESRILIDGGMCQECAKQLGYIVHHKIPLTPYNVNDTNITLNYDNLEYVCKSCHDESEDHSYVFVKKAKPLCGFDEQGNPIDLRDI